MVGQELTVGRYSIAERARGEFDVGQIDLIRAQVMPEGSTDGELAMFLETCIRNDFDPFIHEIWAIKYKGKVQPVVAVDGLRKKANQSSDFKGCSSQAIHEHDHFNFRYEEREDETARVVVEHEPRDSDGKSSHGGRDGSARGPIIGAWARVRRAGDDDVFFIAYSKEYDKSGLQRGGDVWKSHPHAMIKKAAESVALRSAFNIAGVVGEGELTGESGRRQLTEAGAGSPEINWPEDEQLVTDLKQRFEELGYPGAKIRLAVNAREGEEEFRKLLSDLDAEIDARPIDSTAVEDPPVEAEPEAEPSAA